MSINGFVYNPNGYTNREAVLEALQNAVGAPYKPDKPLKCIKPSKSRKSSRRKPRSGH